MRVGVAAEGPTDFLILKHMLLRIRPELDVGQLQPLPVASGVGSKPAGGWREVFRYLESGRLEEALVWYDRVVVHIDADVCEETYFGVARQLDGQVLDDLVLIRAIESRLIREIGPDRWSQVGKKIVFAIAVNEAECWILPLFARSAAEKRKTVGCTGALNRRLSAKFGFSIDIENKNQKYYKKILRSLKQERQVRAAADTQVSLSEFLRVFEEVC